MHRFIHVVCLSSLLWSCQSSVYGPTSPRRSYALSETSTAESVEGRSTFGRPMVLPGGTTRIVPFSRERGVGWFSDRDHFDEGGPSSPGPSAAWTSDRPRARATGHLRWHNGVVFDLESGEQWPLLTQRGVLSRYWMRLDGPDEISLRCGALIFAATVEDTNGDGYLNDLDAIRALMTDRDGRNPRFVTPPSTRLFEVVFDPVEDVAILMIATDTDGDGEFSPTEAPEPFTLDLKSASEVERLIAPETRRAINAPLDGAMP